MPSDPASPTDQPPPPGEEPKAKLPKRSKSGTTRRKKAGKSCFPIITKNRLFAALLFFVAVLTLSALVIRVVLAFAAKEPPTQMQTELARICDYIITAGFSSLIGLLAGRAASPDGVESGEKK